MSSSHTVFCFCNLWGEKENDRNEVQQKRKIVSVNCGHVFHGDCLDRWINLNQTLVAPDDIKCPRCPEKLSMSTRELLLDKGFSHKEETEFKKQIGVAETKILLGITYDQLEGKIALLNPNWMDLTPVFRNELVRTLLKCHRSPHTSKANKGKPLQRIIESGDRDNCELVRLVIDEYIEAITRKNGGKFSWEKMGKPFQKELLQKLRCSSGLANLELRQVPLTPTTFKLLVKEKDDDKILLAVMTSSYIAEMREDSYDVIKSACDLLIQKWFFEGLHTCGNIMDKYAEYLPQLFKLRILERENMKKKKFDFVHDSVEHLFIGMIESRAMELFKYNKTNNVLFKRQDRFSNYYLNYFLDILTAAQTRDECISDTFNDLRFKIIDNRFLIACFLTKSRNTNILKLAITYHEENFYENVLEKCVIVHLEEGTFDDLSFLHLASLNGNLPALKLLVPFLETTKKFIWDPLIILLLQHTSSCRNDVIEMRKEVIAELLKYNNNLFNKRYNLKNRGQITKESTNWGSDWQPYQSPLTPLFVDDIRVELIKFGLQNGANIFTQESGNLQTAVHKAASYMNPSQFHNLVDFVVRNGDSNVLPLKNYDKKTALEIAKSRMKVKPETVKLFSDADNE